MPWWRVNPAGSYVFFVRLGSKPIEFEKGKNAIAVPSLDKIPLVIDILITAVRNGELDDQLAQVKKPSTAAEVRPGGGQKHLTKTHGRASCGRCVSIAHLPAETHSCSRHQDGFYRVPSSITS